MKRWLLTQSILAFHFRRVTSPSHPGLTAAKLKALIAESDIASKNTVFAHLAEMRNYGLLVDVHGALLRRFLPDGRDIRGKAFFSSPAARQNRDRYPQNQDLLTSFLASEGLTPISRS